MTLSRAHRKHVAGQGVPCVRTTREARPVSVGPLKLMGDKGGSIFRMGVFALPLAAPQESTLLPQDPYPREQGRRQQECFMPLVLFFFSFFFF